MWVLLRSASPVCDIVLSCVLNWVPKPPIGSQRVSYIRINILAFYVIHIYTDGLEGSIIVPFI